MASPNLDATALSEGPHEATYETLDSILKDRQAMREVMAEIRELARKTGTASAPEHLSSPGETHVMGPQMREKASTRESGIPAPTGSLRTLTPRKKLATSVSMQSLKGATPTTSHVLVPVAPATTLKGPSRSSQHRSAEVRLSSGATAGSRVIVRDFADLTPLCGETGELRRVASRLDGVVPSTAGRSSFVASGKSPFIFSHHHDSVSFGDGMVLDSKVSTRKAGRTDLEQVRVKCRGLVQAESDDLRQVIENRKTISDLPRRVLDVATKRTPMMPSPLRHQVSEGHFGVSLREPSQANTHRALLPASAKSAYCQLPRATTPKTLLRPTVSHQPLKNERMNILPSGPHVADALEISHFVRELHARDPYINPPLVGATVDNTTFPVSPQTRGYPPQRQTKSHTLNSPTTPKPTSRVALTSPTTPLHSRSVPPKPTTGPRSPKLSLRFASPRDRKKPSDRGASVMPSKDCASALDRALDEQILAYKREGREVLPSGQRIDDLLERRFGTDGVPAGNEEGLDVRGMEGRAAQRKGSWNDGDGKL